MTNVEVEIPDATEPIVAIRAFNYWGSALTSCAVWNYKEWIAKQNADYAAKFFQWEPGINEATCNLELQQVFRIHSLFSFSSPARASGIQHHEAPDEDCACGFWGFGFQHDPVSMLADKVTNHSIYFALWGLIEMWGRVIVGQDGYRSQFARPIALIDKPPPIMIGRLGWGTRKHFDGPKIKSLAHTYKIPVLSSFQIPKLSDPKDFL